MQPTDEVRTGIVGRTRKLYRAAVERKALESAAGHMAAGDLDAALSVLREAGRRLDWLDAGRPTNG